ncbi:MAG: ribonuclease Z [Planctomycetes bacterium]|nr:ribonuclease Z [Planctomycetota bacterium]
MKVTILGSGTAVPVPDRFPAGVLVVTEGERDQVVAVDLGPGVLRRIAQAGYGADRVDAVLFTHYHTDHTADLAALLFALRNPALAQRPTLRLIGHAGLAELLDHLTAAWPWLRPRGYSLEVEEIGPGGFTLDTLRVDAVPIRHTAQSLAYRLTDARGASVAISGDADVCEGLADVARGVDLFICEAAFPDGNYTEGHLTPSLAGAAASEAGATRLCLTHFYPECSGHDLLAQAAQTFDGDVVLAEDLLTFDLGTSTRG